MELAFWAWVTVAVVLGVGEILGSGLYLLPFCLGATNAAALSALGAAPGWQWLVFFAVSGALTVLFRRASARRERRG